MAEDRANGGGLIDRDQLLIEPVIEVLPMNEYNAAEAKLRASVKWLLARAFGGNVPDDFADPFYNNNTSPSNRVQLRPAVMNAMASGDLYAQAASSIFHDQSMVIGQGGMHAVLLPLQRCFGEVIDSDGNPVTETLLQQTAPFRTHCHLAVIDLLMAALARELVTQRSVCAVCKKLGPVQESDLPPPDDAQAALLYWINKVCENVRNRVEMAAAANGQPAPIVPEMDDVYEDICDGACLAAVISYYRPDKLKFRDICFNDPMSLNDCIHNLWLVSDFCRNEWPGALFHFTFEDVLYTHESLKPNLNVFLAELYHLLAGVMQNERPVAVSVRRTVSRISQTVRPVVNCSPTVHREKSLTSRINSIDSLMADHQKASSPKPNRSSSSALGARPLGTVSFLDISAAVGANELDNSGAASKTVTKRQPTVYGRSDTMPCVNLHSTPSLIRMQLEEKRRLYEANRMKRNTELAEQRQRVSKVAFFQVRGAKEPEVTSVSAQQQRVQGNNKNNSDIGLSPASYRHSISGFDELSKNIRDMQEQMKKLSVEQEKLNELVKCRHESTFLLPTTAAPMLNAQSLLCLPTSFGEQSFGRLSNGGGGGGDQSQEDGSCEQQQSFFHLHDAAKSNSRLDPSLDISKSMTDWGLSCAAARKPRKTWDSLASAADMENGFDQRPDRTTSMYELSSAPTATMLDGSGDSVKATVKVKPMVSAERDLSSSVGFVIDDPQATEDEQTLKRKKEQKLAAVLRRREEMELKRIRAEEESFSKRELMRQKQEEQEHRKRERELKRQRVLEEYQRKRAEQEAAEASSTGSNLLISTGSQSSRRPSKSGLQCQPRSQVSLSSSSRVSPLNNSPSLVDLATSATAECSGVSEQGAAEPALKLFVKPVQKSNRTLVYNAIQHSILVGAVNADVKAKVLEELAKSDSKHFLLLFRDQKCQYRGLYSWDQASDAVHKLHGVGPKFCNEAVMHRLYKYDSGSKQFSLIPSRHLSATIDGFTIKEELWQRKSGVTPRR